MSKIFHFDLSSDDVRIKKILGKEFLEIEVYGISNAYPNNNGSYFTDDSMTQALPTFKNKPCLGAFNTKANDFKAHEGKIALDRELGEWFWDTENGEIPLGVIREQDKVEIKEKDDLNWIVFTCALWTQYNYRQVKRLLKSKTKKISVEIMATRTHFDEEGIEVIDEFIFNGFTILGDNVGCGIEGAHLTILDKLEDTIFSQKVAGLQFACEKIKDMEEEKNSTSENEDIFTSELNKNEDGLYIDNKKNEKMSEEGGKNNLLTYREKEELLDMKIKEHLPEDEWGYACDLDETYVFMRTELGTFKMPYSIIEGEDGFVVTIDFDNSVPVVQTWKDYEENSDEEDEDKEDGEGEDKEKGENEDFSENSDASGNSEDDTKENFSEESTNEKNPTVESNEGTKETFDAENFVAKQEYEDLKAKFEALNTEIEGIKAEKTSMQDELEVFKAEKRKAENETFSEYAKGLIDEEDALSSEDTKKEIFEDVSAKCLNGDFKNTESVKDYLEGVLAKAVYAEIKKHKEEKANNSNEEDKDTTEKEFSVNFNKKNDTTVVEGDKSPFDVLSKFNGK